MPADRPISDPASVRLQPTQECTLLSDRLLLETRRLILASQNAVQSSSVRIRESDRLLTVTDHLMFETRRLLSSSRDAIQRSRERIRESDRLLRQDAALPGHRML
jgi:hypothetical protein